MKKSILNFTVILLMSATFLLPYFSFSQVGVGINYAGAVPNTSALLDIDAGTGTKKGLLIPRIALVSSTDGATITNPAATLMVYNLGTGGLSPAGYFYNTGTSGSPVWVQLLNGGSPGTAWALAGNTGTTAGTHFLGTTDATALVFKTNNSEWVRILSGGNVGIGTTVPGAKLEVGSSGARVGIINSTSGVGGYLEFQSSGIAKGLFGAGATLFTNSGAGIRSGPGVPISFSINYATPSMVVDTTGNVGIGTTSPSSLVDINKGLTQATDASDFRLRIAGGYNNIGGTDFTSGLVFDRTSNHEWRAAAPAIRIDGLNQLKIYARDGGSTEAAVSNQYSGASGYGELRLSTQATNAAGDTYFSIFTGGSTGANERLRITSIGNVGIGTTAPNFKLDVQGSNASNTTIFTGTGFGNIPSIFISNTNTTANNYSGIGFGRDASGNAGAGVMAQFVNHTTGQTNLIFGTDSGEGFCRERMRILSDGKVGIGATSPSTELDVTGSIKASNTITAPIYATTTQTLTDGATITWTATSGLNAKVTLAGNRTLAISGAPTGSYGTLVVTQDATGSRTLTLPASSKVIGAASAGVVTLSTTANKVDILTFYYDGTTYFWNVGLNYN
jgi:hypothetical protein